MKRRIRLSCLTVILVSILGACAAPATWCVGMWGRQSVNAQQWLQPFCPEATEAMRYQPFQVLVPAKDDPLFLSISPDRRLILTIHSRDDQLALWDVVRKQPALVGNRKDARFLTNLIFITYLDDRQYFRLVNLESGVDAQIRRIDEPGTDWADESTLQLLRNADRIVAVKDRFVVALSISTDTSQSIGIEDYKQVVEVLKREGLPYIEVPENGVVIEEHLLDGQSMRVVPSGNGLYWARPEGIYSGETGELLVATGYVGFADIDPEQRQIYLSPVGWTPDDHAVVYVRQVNWYRAYWPLFWDEPPAQPILLLELPSQYWPEPSATAAPAP